MSAFLPKAGAGRPNQSIRKGCEDVWIDSLPNVGVICVFGAVLTRSESTTCAAGVPERRVLERSLLPSSSANNRFPSAFKEFKNPFFSSSVSGRNSISVRSLDSWLKSRRSGVNVWVCFSSSGRGRKSLSSCRNSLTRLTDELTFLRIHFTTYLLFDSQRINA